MECVREMRRRARQLQKLSWMEKALHTKGSVHIFPAESATALFTYFLDIWEKHEGVLSTFILSLPKCTTEESGTNTSLRDHLTCLLLLYSIIMLLSYIAASYSLIMIASCSTEIYYRE